MTNWKADLDALVEATTALTKSVRVEPPMPRTIVEPNRMPPVNLNNSERDEIGQRVANFKAHQQRFIRERMRLASFSMSSVFLRLEIERTWVSSFSRSFFSASASSMS